jgi:uncharacterized repeat protein (TIGR03803 family)
LVFGLLAAPAQASDRQILHNQVPADVANAAPLRHSPRWTKLNLSISLPLRDRPGLTNLLQQLYDPASPNFRHYLTPEQFAQRFGPTEEDYQAVVGFAHTHGLLVTATHPNRTLVSARGTVADIERAFHVTLNEYQHPTESRVFYAPDGEPSLDLTTPVLGVSGLDNFVVPHPCLQLRPPGPATPQQTGSGPDGSFLGKDFRAAYAPGVALTGTGQIAGMLEFDSGFYQSDITAYENLAGLPNVPVTAILLDGYGGGPGDGNVEVSLDIEMAISVAPGLAGVLVYEGSTTDDILSRIATDNLAKQIAASWTYPMDAESDQIWLQMAAQGQSFFNASGDDDAYAGQPLSPTDDPNITVVGGTALTTVSAGGAWASETVYQVGGGQGSGGGISTDIPIPIWQQGVSMATNQGSTIYRNLPDVALTAEDIYVAYGDGESGGVNGTSCAVQLWGAYTALINQLALENNEPTAGFINPAIYAIGKGSNVLSYTTLFHDITTGNNENSSSPTRFVAVPGFDLCTGWGTPSGSNLIMAIALPEPLRITPATSPIFTGPVGGPFAPASQIYSLTNSGPGSFHWSAATTSAAFMISPTSGTLVSGGPADAVTVRLAQADTNLPAGSYSAALWFTNLEDDFAQSRQLTLDVVTPPVITQQPTNVGALEGQVANFSVGTGPNALILYQWRKNGVNLTDAGTLSGSATSNLTINGVVAGNAGTYSVVLSNAAGMLDSSNATLSIVASKPVIIQQPTNLAVLPGAPASFSVTVNGNTPYSYSWLFNGRALTASGSYSGVATSNLLISFVSATNAGIYSVIIGNALGSATSTGAVLSLIPITVPGLAMATLWSFTDVSPSGEYPYCPLAQGADGFLYGTTIEGGVDNDGTVFKCTTNGVLFPLHSFDDTDGAIPYGGLCLGKDGFFYGTAYFGGIYGDGEVFRTTSAGAFSISTSLNGDDGEFPVAGMVQGSDGNFYGTTLEGGDFGDGTLFRVTPSGVLTTLVSFDGASGADPSAVLTIGSDGDLYGTTEVGGTYGGGTVFKMTLSGDFTRLYSFTGGDDGAIPVAGVVQAADGNFYGTTYEYGAYGFGTVYEITSSGVFTPLYSFTGGADGGSPWGGLVQSSDGNLYGTTTSEGAYGFGTVFQIAPTGSLATLAQFDGYVGADPSAALMQGKDGSLYGTTESGGADDVGTIFRLSISGALQITGQPADQEVNSGATALFSVATFGGAPVSYQWQQFGVNLTNGGGISGANTANLTISNASDSDSAFYSVVVSNAVSSVTSDEALLEVIYSPPSITTQPASQMVEAGMTASFTVAAAGDQPISYQWQENGINLTDGGFISGSSTISLTISNVELTNAGTYSVIVSDPIHAVPSANATLTVVPVTPPGASTSSLHLFSGNSDGAFPYAGLAESRDGNLYGTAESGGSEFYGDIFRVSLAGTFTTLYDFTSGTSGANPHGGLTLAANGELYGTTTYGGANGDGSIFSLSTSPVAVRFLYFFEDGNDGSLPIDTMVQGSNGKFYGTAEEGGSNTFGSVFQVSVAGAITFLTPLYGFTGGNDGGYPYAGVIQGRDGNLYGTTLEDGVHGYGTVFSLKTNSTLTTLAAFDGNDGAYLYAGVIQGANGDLYGCTYEGGSNEYGTVFSLSTGGTLTTLFSFGFTNGGYPVASLVQGTDGNLYGTTSSGGVGGQGTAFRITTNGTLTTLLSFDGLNGAEPGAALLQASDGSFYGTTVQGGAGFNPSAGAGGNGVIFKLTVPIFISNSITLASAMAGAPYSSSISNFAVAPPGDVLSFSKVSGPLWLNVATNGVLSGAPPASDLGTNLFVFGLADTNGMFASANFIISVIPGPPVIAQVPNQFVLVGQNIVISNSAVVATPPVTFSLDASAPPGAEITTNGVFNWDPSCAQGSTTNEITIWATDSGTPQLSNSMTFFITVGECVQLGVGSAVLQVGTSKGIPVSLFSTVGITNLSFVLGVPANRFTNFTITSSNASIATATVQTAGSSPPLFILAAQPGQTMQSSSVLGTIGFTALAGNSAFVPVLATNISGFKSDGSAAGNVTSLPGQITVLGLHPLLAPTLNGNSTVTLTLYGNPGSNYQLAYTTNLALTNWQAGSNILLTNVQQNINVPATNAQMYFRLQ